MIPQGWHEVSSFDGSTRHIPVRQLEIMTRPDPEAVKRVTAWAKRLLGR